MGMSVEVGKEKKPRIPGIEVVQTHMFITRVRSQWGQTVIPGWAM
jgi:hypothetical protein